MRPMFACHQPRLVCLALLASLAVGCGTSATEATDGGPDETPTDTPDAGDASEPERPSSPDAGAPDAEAPRPQTVTGVVVSSVDQPLRGIGVKITGKPPVVADDSGRFSVPDVLPPYDLTVYETGESPSAHVFVGLSTPTPRVIPAWKLVTNEGGRAKVTGTIGAVSAGEGARVCVEGVTRAVYGCAEVAAGAGAYTIQPASWTDDVSTVEVRVHALRFKGSDGSVTSYTGYGAASGTLTGGSTATLDVTLGAPPATTTVTASLVPPAGMARSGLGAGVTLPSGVTLVVGAANASTVDLTKPLAFLMPALPGATFTIFGAAEGAASNAIGWEPAVAAAGTAAPKLVALPAWISPSDGATDLTTQTPLELDAPFGTQLTVLCKPEGAGSGRPTFVVSTVKSTLTLPDLADLGLSLPPAVTYVCDTTAAWSATAGADAMVTGLGASGGFIGALQLPDGRPLKERGAFSFSKTSRTFTTK